VHEYTDHHGKRWAAAVIVAAISVVAAVLAAGPATASTRGGKGTYTLTVTLTGSGSGSVTSDPTGIDCPPTCQAEFPNEDETVTLTAVPDAGSSFVQWTGCDSSTRAPGRAFHTCDVEMFNPRDVTAEFASNGPTMIKPSTAYQRQKAKFDVSWTSVAGTGVKYDVQVQSAPYTTGHFGAFSAAKTGLTSTLFHFTGTPGTSYCFRARSRTSGGSSPYSATKCTTVPLDDRSLTRHGTWTENHLFGYYLNTFLRTKTHGASLTMAGVHGSEVAVEATKCSACGSIRVTWAGASHTFSLVASETHREQLFVLAGPEDPSAGLVTILVTSTNKKVEIDGLGARAPLPGV
jgi:hypothetical protein